MHFHHQLLFFANNQANRTRKLSPYCFPSFLLLSIGRLQSKYHVFFGPEWTLRLILWYTPSCGGKLMKCKTVGFRIIHFPYSHLVRKYALLSNTTLTGTNLNMFACMHACTHKHTHTHIQCSCELKQMLWTKSERIKNMHFDDHTCHTFLQQLVKLWTKKESKGFLCMATKCQFLWVRAAEYGKFSSMYMTPIAKAILLSQPHHKQESRKQVAVLACKPWTMMSSHGL